MTTSEIKKYGFEPTEKEKELFNKQKKDMYKGTFYVCLAYGLAAILLLIFGAFTEWGREYIYGKMLPATATFVIGALFIIIYLSSSIYSLKPKQLKSRQDADSSVVCPDYWKLEKIGDAERTLLKNEYNTINDTKTIQDSDPMIQYKCTIDPHVLSVNKMSTNNTLYDTQRYEHGYTKSTPASQRSESNPDYVYVKKGEKTYTDVELAKYATISGFYSDTNAKIATLSGDVTQADKPLKCNVVYPSILDKMDAESNDESKQLKCLYANACDVPWTQAECEYVPQK